MNRIKLLRVEQGMKQSELGELLNVKDAAISKYESGKIPLTDDTLIHLSEIFHVSIDYILGLTNERIPNNDFEWRYPKVSNRLGTILSTYRQHKQISESDFAKELEITEELEIKLEQGIYTPSIPLLKKIASITGYDIDYLTGAINHTSTLSGETIEIGDQTIPIYQFEGDSFFHSRFEHLYLKKGITNENVEELVGITKQEFLDIRYNRMPTLAEIAKIARAFDTSIDYLMGRVDTPLFKLSDDELSLLLNYRDCIPKYKKNIYDRTEKLSIESIDSSVAADEQLKRTGTENMGK